jgi:hypothetical protein
MRFIVSFGASITSKRNYSKLSTLHSRLSPLHGKLNILHGKLRLSAFRSRHSIPNKPYATAPVVMGWIFLAGLA